MTTISPLLKSRLEASKNHENIYRHLTEHANDVKPNLPKAKLIKENFFQSMVSGVKDTYNDGKNFFKATKTGQLNDNNLGRINDLGMKAGALLIASFLATHAKTKTDAIMQFIGGTTFFASMSLWPKLFINLPARLAHGFRVDYKYLSAQGDKKDLGLDNQFQPMDIFSDEEMLKMAQNAGINPKDEFAKEKMQRKLQKTMLQNRTLWMATAGFATPLMTSLAGSAIEPLVRKGVINFNFNKVKNIVKNDGINDHVARAGKIVRNTKEIEQLFENKTNAALDKDFYSQLSDLLELDLYKQFKDPDDIKAAKLFKSKDLIPALEKVREQNSYIDKDNLIKVVSEMKTKGGFIEDIGSAKIGIEKATSLFKDLGNQVSIDEAKSILQTKTKLSSSQIEQLLKEMPVDNSKFFIIIKNYNQEVVSTLRGRAKSYLDLINPLVGSKSESVYTQEYNETIKKLLKILNISDKEYELMQKQTVEQQQEFLSSKMQKFVKKDKNYLETLTGISKKEFEEILQEETPKAQAHYIMNRITDLKEYIEFGDNELKKGLTNVFGSEFYLVKDESKFKDFLKYYTKDNEIWKNEIFDSYKNGVSGIDLGAKYKEYSDVLDKYISTKETYIANFKEAIAKIFGEDFPLIKVEKRILDFIEDIRNNKALNLDEIVYLDSKKYARLINKMFHKKIYKVEEVIDALKNRDNINKIGEVPDDIEVLTRAILGGREGHQGLSNYINDFIINQRTDLLSTKYKPIIAANFEARLAKGKFAQFSEEQIEILKKIVYDNPVSAAYNRYEIRDKAEIEELVNALLNKEAFRQEADFVPGIQKAVEELKQSVLNPPEKDFTPSYLKAGSFTELLKNFGTRLNENKAWKKIFLPMSIALVAVTLFVQPFFGKIGKEFPKKGKKEGVNNGNK